MYAISAYILICLHTCWGMCSGTVTPLSKLVIEEFTLESKTALRSITLSTSPTNTHTSFLNNGNNPKVEWEHAKKTHFTQMKVVSALKNTFLPIGYPISVPPEYSTFQVWNILQDFCSYLRGIMGTKAILEGLGVGRADATSLSATLAWIVRDGVSMLGSLLFTSLSSSTFGQNVKSWRYFADTINNIGITLDMLAPLSKKFFVPIICLASICKALCGVAAGAAGASISEHWGAQGNIADVLAKNGAQHTLVNVLGLLFSVRFARFTSTSPKIMWLFYTSLTALHMYSNWKAMKVLAFRSLNIQRSRLLLQAYSSCITRTNNNDVCFTPTNPAQFSLEQIASKEPIIMLPKIFHKDSIRLWADPIAALRLVGIHDFQKYVNRYENTPYVIFRLSENSSANNFEYLVTMKRVASSMDQLQAYFEAHLYESLGMEPGLLPFTQTSRLFKEFIELIRGLGWNCERIMLDSLGSKSYEFSRKDL